MQLSQARNTTRRISLTPLIDVVFLLLIFFMLSSTFLKFTGLDIKGGQTGAASGDIANLVLVRVHADNKVEVNGKTVLLDNLKQHLAALGTSETPETPETKAIKGEMHIVIKALGGVTIQRVVDVIEQVRSQTVRKISVVK